MAQWNKNTVPKCENKKCSGEVLVTVERIGYGGKLYRRVIKAVYFPYHHCTVDDMTLSMDYSITGDWEYCEEQNSYWIPQGWYNADRIRGMSDKELAEWITNICDIERHGKLYKSIYNLDTEQEEEIHDSYGDLLKWLQLEAE